MTPSHVIPCGVCQTSHFISLPLVYASQGSLCNLPSFAAPTFILPSILLLNLVCVLNHTKRDTSALHFSSRLPVSSLFFLVPFIFTISLKYVYSNLVISTPFSSLFSYLSFTHFFNSYLKC